MSLSTSNPTLDALLSSPIGTKWSGGTTRVSYTQEIQLMMHAFGDHHKPLFESAQLIEEIVHQQMTTILSLACDVASSRGSRFTGLEDILFLMRREKVKLARIVRYLAVKDMKNVIKSSVGLEEEEMLEVAFNASQDNNNSTAGNNNGDSAAAKPQQSKRVKLCYDFLSSIDQRGSLLEVFDDNFVDALKHERDVRIDRLASSLSQAHYIKYSEARQASFANKARPTKFRDWLLKDSQIELKPNIFALEVLQYLAYETVAQIVEMSLIVKQDNERDACDPLTALLPNKMSNPDFPLFQDLPNQSADNEDFSACVNQASGFFLLPQTNAKSMQQKHLLSSPIDSKNSKKRKKGEIKLSFESSQSYCITPNHIREAMRRHCTPTGPFVKLMKVSHSMTPPSKKLICI